MSKEIKIDQAVVETSVETISGTIQYFEEI